MSEKMVEEYKMLRQELEMNRRFVFERPLLIVGATLAAALSRPITAVAGLLPIPFLGVLLFNLWFTFNRLWSSARIVAYIQLVHEGQRELEWIGWENALRKFRSTAFSMDEAERTTPRAEKEAGAFLPMGYYAPIFYFHILFGAVLTALPLFPSALSGNTDALPSWLRFADVVAFIAFFCWAVTRFRPGNVRGGTERQREIWKAALRLSSRHSCPLRATPALFISLAAVKSDSVLTFADAGARKLLVTSLYPDKEMETQNVVWKPPPPGEKCPVQVMSDTELALFTHHAPQDRHFHRTGTDLYVVLEGRMTIEVSDQDYSLSSGDMIIVNPTVVHRVKPEGSQFVCGVMTANCGGPADKFVVS